MLPNPRLLEVLYAFRQIDPSMLSLFPHRVARRRKVGVRKRTDRYAVMLGPEIKMPVDRTAAGGTEVKADRASICDVARVNLFWAFDLNLRLREIRARVHDRAGPPLASFAVTAIHDRRFSGNCHTK